MRSAIFTLPICLGLSSAALAADQDCTLKPLASVPLLENARPVIEVSVGDRKLHFLVDTGGVTSEIDSDVAAELGLELHTITNGIELYNVSGDISKKYARVENFTLDHLRADRINMVVRDRDPGAKDIDGVLGPDVLKQYDVDFDFGGHKFNLISPDHCPGKVVYWTNDFAEVDFTNSDPHVVLPMTLDGHDLSTTVDTGSNSTALAEHIARMTFGLNETSPGVELLPNAGPDDVVRSRYRFGSLTVGGLAIKNPLIYIMRDLAQKAYRQKHNDKADLDPVYGSSLNTPQLILGMNVLSKLHLYISYKEDKLYLTPASATR